MSEKRSAVFLSHSSDNFKEVEMIAEILENTYDIPCWYAPRNIQKGDQYYLRIVEDIEEKVGLLVVFISEEVGKSKFVPKEVDRAFYYNKPIIPYMLDHSPLPKNLEFSLCDHQWINHETEGVERLVEAIEDHYKRMERGEFKISKNPEAKEPVIIKSQKSIYLYKINNYLLHKIHQLYVPFPKMKEAQRSLEKEHYVFLYHPEHTGKYSAAISCLQQVGLTEIYEFSSEISLTELYSHPIKSNTGLILEMEEELFLKGFSEQKFELFTHKLRNKNCKIVFVSKDAPPISVVKSTKVLVEPPGDVKELVKKYVTYQVEEEESYADLLEWLETEESAMVLPKQIMPKGVRDIVLKIDQYLKGEIDKQHFNKSLNENAQERIKDWFRENDRNVDIAMYLTIGIFEGQPYSFILGKAREFAAILQEEFPTEGEDNLYIRSAKDEVLQKFHAIVKQEWKHDDIGSDLREGVYFQYQDDAKIIWDYTWKQLSFLKAPLTKWLMQLIFDKNIPNKRLNAVLVHLFQNNFSEFRKEIIQPIAKSEVPKERWVAVKLVEDAFEDESMKSKIFQLVKTWTKQMNNDRLQWSGIVLLGGPVGLANFPTSLELLEPLIVNRKNMLFHPVQKSVQQLSRVLYWGEIYEQIYLKFWAQLFEKVEEKKLFDMMRFAQGIFMMHPNTILSSNDRYNLFWFSFFNTLYKKSTQHTLLEKLAKVALGNEEKEKRLAEIMHKVVEKGYPNSRLRMKDFIHTKLEKIDSPIYLNDFIQGGV